MSSSSAGGQSAPTERPKGDSSARQRRTSERGSPAHNGETVTQQPTGNSLSSYLPMSTARNSTLNSAFGLTEGQSSPASLSTGSYTKTTSTAASSSFSSLQTYNTRHHGNKHVTIGSTGKNRSHISPWQPPTDHGDTATGTPSPASTGSQRPKDPFVPVPQKRPNLVRCVCVYVYM